MIRSSYLIRKIRWVAMETDWLSDDTLSVRGRLWLTGGVQLIAFKCPRIISVPQWLKHGGELRRASHSQLEKTRGHECSSMGKLCSCSWHSALMVSLEDGKSSHKYTFLSIIVASNAVFFCDVIRLYEGTQSHSFEGKIIFSAWKKKVYVMINSWIWG